MFNRYAGLLVAGAAFVALGASSASAQSRPTSTKRIPVSKESPGEVAPRVDTLTVYKTDTLRMEGRVDTLRLTNTVTVHDTLIQSIPMTPRQIGGMYFGVGGGVGVPFGAIRTVNNEGELAQFQIGWQGLKQALGLRVDGMWNHFSRNPNYSNLGIVGTHVDQAKVLTGNLDARLNLPIFNMTLGSSVRMVPYLLGGGSVVHYSDLRMKIDTESGATDPSGFGAVFASDANTATQTGSATSFGFNFGGGLGFHAGKKEVFVESRGVAWKHGPSGMFDRSWNVPIVFGVNFY